MSKLDEAIEAALDATAGSFRRRMAVSDLGRSEDERAFETLIALLEDEDAYLRREVVSSLSRQSDRRVVEPLIAALSPGLSPPAVSTPICFTIYQVLKSFIQVMHFIHGSTMAAGTDIAPLRNREKTRDVL